MTNKEIKELQEQYENTLKEKIEGKTFHISECVQLVNTIGNEFINIASGILGIKEFHLQQEKEDYVSALTYKIFCMEHKIADIIISVSEIDESTLTMDEIMCDFKINEEMLEEIIQEIKQKQEEIARKEAEKQKTESANPSIEFTDLEDK